jgi:hypothetical protein
MRTFLALCLIAFSASAADDDSIGWQIRGGDQATSVVDPGAPFRAIGISWSSKRPDLIVRARVSEDRRNWSGWTQLAIDEDLTDASSGRYFSAITSFDDPKRHLEYAFSGPVDNVRLTLFRPTRAVAAHAPRSAVDSRFGAVAIRSRSAWGCPDGQTARWTPSYSTVTHAVVHHTAGSNSDEDFDAVVRSIWYYHTVSNDWGDIGYNFLVAPNGTIYEGRAGGAGAIGAHFSCRNTNTVGVALLGTFTSASPTDAALDSLERLMGEICTRHAIDPTANVRHTPSGLHVPTIIGHRDGNVPGATCTVTSCPGDVLYSMLPGIRTDMACRPVIESHPSSVTVRPGDTAALRVTARGQEPFFYEWYAGESPLEGGNTPEILVSPSSVATYWVRVTNACASADSLTATVNVVTSAPRRRSVRR